MTNSIDIDFLKERITSIQTALFFSQDIGVMKIPNSVVHILKVDDDGQMWFFIHRPRQYLFAFNETFHARLDFYKKGAKCFLLAAGNVSMIDEQPDVDPAMAGKQDLEWPFTGRQLMLMKMKILQVT
jgi:hypothetical protein